MASHALLNGRMVDDSVGSAWNICEMVLRQGSHIGVQSAAQASLQSAGNPVQPPCGQQTVLRLTMTALMLSWQPCTPAMSAAHVQQSPWPVPTLQPATSGSFIVSSEYRCTMHVSDSVMERMSPGL